MATAVPTKTSGRYTAERVLAFMKEIGAEKGELTVKSDQEASIQAVIAEVGRLRATEAGAGKPIVEVSPVGSSGSNGVIERAVRSVEQQVRVMRSALGARASRKICGEAPSDDVDSRLRGVLTEQI